MSSEYCPKCGSTKVKVNTTLSVNPVIITPIQECLSCGYSWDSDIYRRVSALESNQKGIILPQNERGLDLLERVMKIEATNDEEIYHKIIEAINELKTKIYDGFNKRLIFIEKNIPEIFNKIGDIYGKITDLYDKIRELIKT